MNPEAFYTAAQLAQELWCCLILETGLCTGSVMTIQTGLGG